MTTRVSISKSFLPIPDHLKKEKEKEKKKKERRRRRV